ncbi:hypothetical protein D9758_005787 [Tetrapyrgos nigripes]|uniref:Uncharacterized protein n=1 Tax=Tetrapyrgos nigripes TaxID=182062 RepID=A0A8H5LQV3_9AGAR|nr:hypothetical protein D9758_005787 [Tetrapyrgos nigripes]
MKHLAIQVYPSNGLLAPAAETSRASHRNREPSPALSLAVFGVIDTASCNSSRVFSRTKYHIDTGIRFRCSPFPHNSTTSTALQEPGKEHWIRDTGNVKLVLRCRTRVNAGVRATIPRIQIVVEGPWASSVHQLRYYHDLAAKQASQGSRSKNATVSWEAAPRMPPEMKKNLAIWIPMTSRNPRNFQKPAGICDERFYSETLSSSHLPHADVNMAQGLEHYANIGSLL